MRRFLRFLMLVLMATWEAQGYAECVLIQATNVTNSTNTYTSGDITISITPGVYDHTYWQFPKMRHEDHTTNNWDIGGYTGASTGDAIKIPVASDFTVSCKGGAIDYILFSFNNGHDGLVCHSEYWSRICVADGTNTKGNYYHTHDNSAGNVDNSWWGGYGSGSTSVTFYDDRTSTNGGDEQTTGVLWLYVFYHKGSTITQSVALKGTNRRFCRSDTTVVLTRSNENTSVNNYDSNLAMYYTVDGNTPTTSSSTYGSEIELKCTRQIKVLNQARLKLAKMGGKAGGSDMPGLPDYYNAVSDVVTLDRVTKLCKVTFNGAGCATFAHDNNMTLPAGYKAAAYTIKSWRNGNKTPSVLAPITPYYDGNANGRKVVKANTAVIVFGTAGKSIWLTNPLNDDPANDGGTQTVSNNILQGNFSYGAATATNNSQLDFYYLMQEYRGSSKYGFYWGAADGRPASLGAHKAYFTVSNTARKSGSGAKGFVFEMPDDETTGIAGVFVSGETGSPSLDANAPMYNAAGQRVGVDYKGIVIQNGRKFIKR